MAKWFPSSQLGYIGKRILIFIPTMIVITLVGFVIAINAPGDPVERMMTSSHSGGEIGTNSISQIEDKKHWRKKLGLDLPVFYFSLTKLSYPDTLYRIYEKQETEALSILLDEYGNWKEISAYYLGVSDFQKHLSEFKASSIDTAKYDEVKFAESLNNMKFEAIALRSTSKEDVILSKINTIKTFLASYDFLTHLKIELQNIERLFSEIKTNAAFWKNYVPAVHFYGKNQYHRWLFGDGETTKGLIGLDFGISYQNRKPVTQKIMERIPWSMFFSLTAVLLSYLVSIPLGVRAAQRRGSKFDKISSFILYALFSMPSFFVALVLMTFFSSPDFLGWLPAVGVKPAEGYPEDAGFFEKAMLSLPYIILPLISYTYHSFAYLSRTMRSSMLEVVNQDYIRTARAKGLSERVVIWKHAFRNSLLPIITLFANIFPAAIGGSVIIEYIFTIPGMGNEIVNSALGNDHPMIIAILTIAAILTLIGYLISDILYSIVDPRIKHA